MRFFASVEMLGLVFFVSYNIFGIVLNKTHLSSNESNMYIFHSFGIFFEIFYTFSQAYGILKLKDSVDPIENISKLAAILIISKN
jgi:hypothetical protein